MRRGGSGGYPCANAARGATLRLECCTEARARPLPLGVCVHALRAADACHCTADQTFFAWPDSLSPTADGVRLSTVYAAEISLHAGRCRAPRSPHLEQEERRALYMAWCLAETPEPGRTAATHQCAQGGDEFGRPQTRAAGVYFALPRRDSALHAAA